MTMRVPTAVSGPLLACALVWGAQASLAQSPGGTAPYAGLEGRSIAALSADDIAALEAGQGWGFALSAELNGYPGPLHLLENADAIGLDAQQRAAIAAVFDAMQSEAKTLGREFIAAEAALDAAFSNQTITPQTLAGLTAEAGRLRAELRALHLAAHLEVTPLLSRHQLFTYNSLRGYAGGQGAHSGGHGKH